jgi:hypothetical protein
MLGDESLNDLLEQPDACAGATDVSGRDHGLNLSHRHRDVP